MYFDYSKVTQSGTYDKIRGLVSFVFKHMYKITYVGTENIPEDGPLIIACNHQHALDPFIISNSCPRVVHYMAKKELYKNKIAAKILVKLNSFPIERGVGDMDAVNYSCKIVEQGGAFGIFPEGTRQHTYKPAPRGKSGVAWILRETNADLLPVSIYTDEEFKIGTKLTVRFGKVIKNGEFEFTKAHSPRELRNASAKVMQAITELWEEGHCNE
ncbi:MAG: 1-acyl-sn-glycerol-3-phosphate acyltransferase [Ruminococcaceae bacterium]|nr:1-acyl-sn-glycerol-3-phosphate acyltransferase [Oscillospiraceae bacterium]